MTDFSHSQEISSIDNSFVCIQYLSGHFKCKQFYQSLKIGFGKSVPEV